MLIVADSSPLHLLIEIRATDVLPRLFRRVAIPTEVAQELSRPRTPQAVRDFMAMPPTWLEILCPAHLEDIAELDSGERAAISLAHELKADLLLIDEKVGRRIAARRKLNVIGSLGVLDRAARGHLLDLTEMCNRIRQTRFHVTERLLQQLLARHRSG